MESPYIIDILKSYEYNEDSNTLKLFDDLVQVRKRKFYLKSEFIKVLKWKSPRPLKYYKENPEEYIEEVTRLALNQSNDKLKIHILTALNGVSYPAASTLLMFYDMESYPVIDIRVWKLLYEFNLVKNNQRGQNFTINQWSEYLSVLRDLSNKMEFSVRKTEKVLFDFHKKERPDKLYS